MFTGAALWLHQVLHPCKRLERATPDSGPDHDPTATQLDLTRALAEILHCSPGLSASVFGRLFEDAFSRRASSALGGSRLAPTSASSLHRATETLFKRAHIHTAETNQRIKPYIGLGLGITTRCLGTHYHRQISCILTPHKWTYECPSPPRPN